MYSAIYEKLLSAPLPHRLKGFSWPWRLVGTVHYRTPFRRSISKTYIKSVSFALLILCSHSVTLLLRGLAPFTFWLNLLSLSSFGFMQVLSLSLLSFPSWSIFKQQQVLSFQPVLLDETNHTLLIFHLAALLCICFSLSISFSNSTDQNYNYSQLWLPAACAIESVSSFPCRNGHCQEVS